jgi:hypothetical protein
MRTKYSSLIVHRSLFLAAILAFVTIASAQPQQSTNFRITKSVLNAGGQSSASANFRLTSSFGQPTPIGTASSGNFALTAGFLTPSFAVSPLSPIQDLVIQPQGADILLVWSNIPGAAMYKIYRAADATTGPSPSSLIATVSDTSYTDSNITGSDNRDFYIVTALNGAGVLLQAAHSPVSIAKSPLGSARITRSAGSAATVKSNQPVALKTYSK